MTDAPEEYRGTARPSSAARVARLVPLASAVFAVVLMAIPLPAGASPALGAAHAPTAPTTAAPASTVHAIARAAGAVPGASSNSFNPYCYKIDTTVCVSIKYYGETDIVPNQGSTVCPSEPNATASLPIIVKSHNPLNYSVGATPHNGPYSPIELNVTGVLWNGDPFYSTYDGTVWHAPSNNWWVQLPKAQNLSYPWWYEVNLTAHSNTGALNWFPGMTITWWILLTYNDSGHYVHHEGPRFQCTYSGAWPYSPYPTSHQYAGGGAVYGDINLTLQPRSPNWNDSIRMVLNTTQADVAQNATIGNAYLDLNETSDTGIPITNGTIAFPVTINGNQFGAVTSTAIIPQKYAQVANAHVTFWLSVFDVAGDQLVTPEQNYTVGGNGSFASGIFTDDLQITTNPNSVENAVSTTALNPGQQLNVSLISRNPGTAINFAEISYTLGYPQLNEQVSGAIPMTRVSSTIFTGHLPGFPLATTVNFTVLAWDFSQRLEKSPELPYYIPNFGSWVPILPVNQTFFYVYVYDNGSHSWVDGAKVNITGPHNYFNSVTNTTLGVAYPNITRSPYVPLLLQANASYRITVDDPSFAPPPDGFSSPISVMVLGLHSMSNHQTLAVGSTYLVVQEGDAILFYLNATGPMPQASPSTSGGNVPIGAIGGLIGVAVVMVVVIVWWGQIRARRKEEEKRVTL